MSNNQPPDRYPLYPPSLAVGPLADTLNAAQKHAYPATTNTKSTALAADIRVEHRVFLDQYEQNVTLPRQQEVEATKAMLSLHLPDYYSNGTRYSSPGLELPEYLQNSNNSPTVTWRYELFDPRRDLNLLTEVWLRLQTASNELLRAMHYVDNAHNGVKQDIPESLLDVTASGRLWNKRLSARAVMAEIAQVALKEATYLSAGTLVFVPGKRPRRIKRVYIGLPLPNSPVGPEWSKDAAQIAYQNLTHGGKEPTQDDIVNYFNAIHTNEEAKEREKFDDLKQVNQLIQVSNPISKYSELP